MVADLTAISDLAQRLDVGSDAADSA